MVSEATGGHHLVDQHGLHCAWWTGAKNSMIWIQQRQKKKQINVSHNFNFLGASCQAMGASLCDWFFLGDCHFLPAILPQVWLLIHKSMFSTMLTNSLSLSLIDPSSTGKGEGWTSPNYRNTGGRGPPPGGGPRRLISFLVWFFVIQTN